MCSEWKPQGAITREKFPIYADTHILSQIFLIGGLTASYLSTKLRSETVGSKEDISLAYSSKTMNFNRKSLTCWVSSTSLSLFVWQEHSPSETKQNTAEPPGKLL